MAVEKASFDNAVGNATKASRIAFEETLNHFNETFAKCSKTVIRRKLKENAQKISIQICSGGIEKKA